MAFNREKALAAGYTNQEIDSYLAKNNKSSSQYSTSKTITGPVAFAHQAGDFLGMSDFAKGLAQVAARKSNSYKNYQKSESNLQALTQQLIDRANQYKAGDPRREKLLKNAQENYGLISGQESSYANQLPTNKQFISGAINTALNVASAGNLKGVGAGSFGITKQASIPLKQLILQNAITGAGMGASRAYGSDKSTGDIIKSGLASGATSAAITGILGGLGKLLSGTQKVTLQTGPEKLYKASVGLVNDSDVQPLLDAGVVGNRKQLQDIAFKAISETEKKISSSPSAGNQIQWSQILESKPIKELLDKADLVGERESVMKLLEKILPKPENILNELQNRVNDLGGLAAEAGTQSPQQQQFVEAFKNLISEQNKASKNTVLDVLARRRALSDFLPDSVLNNNSTAVAGQTKGAINQALTNSIRDVAPDVGSLVKSEQPYTQLLEAIKKYSQRRASGTVGPFEVIGRGLFTPTVMTRIAQGGNITNYILNALKNQGISPAVRNVLRGLINNAIANSKK